MLQKLPLLYVFVAAAAGGFLLDVRLRLLELRGTQILKLVLLFMGWTTLCNAVMAGQHLVQSSIELAILFVLFATIAHGVQRLRTLRIVTGTLLMTCLGLAALGVHQGMQERTCIILDEERRRRGHARRPVVQRWPRTASATTPSPA